MIEHVYRRASAARSIESVLVATDVASRGLHIENVTHVAHPGNGSLDPRTLRSNASTIENIRLWAPDVLRNVYLNLQRIKQYYQFVSPADADRYTIGGRPQHLMIGTREISPNGLTSEAKTWVNTHLFYTHGYGVVSSDEDPVADSGIFFAETVRQEVWCSVHGQDAGGSHLRIGPGVQPPSDLLHL